MTLEQILDTLAAEGYAPALVVAPEDVALWILTCHSSNGTYIRWVGSFSQLREKAQAFIDKLEAFVANAPACHHS